MRQFSRPSHLCTLEVDPADPKRRTVDRESAYPEQLFTHLPASRVARRLCTLLPGLRCIFGPFLKRKSVPAVSPRSAGPGAGRHQPILIRHLEWNVQMLLSLTGQLGRSSSSAGQPAASRSRASRGSAASARNRSSVESPIWISAMSV